MQQDMYAPGSLFLSSFFSCTERKQDPERQEIVPKESILFSCSVDWVQVLVGIAL
jgi:hypothetical protein